MYKKLSFLTVLTLVSFSLFAKSPDKSQRHFSNKKHKPAVANVTKDFWTYTLCCDGSQEATGLTEIVYGSNGTIIWMNTVTQPPSLACETCTI